MRSAALVAFGALAACGSSSAFVPPMESRPGTRRPERGDAGELVSVSPADGDGCLDGRPLQAGDRVRLALVDGGGARERYEVAANGGIVGRIDAVDEAAGETDAAWSPMLAVPWQVTLGGGVAHVVDERGELRTSVAAPPPTWRSAAGVECEGRDAATAQVFRGGEIVVVAVQHTVSELCAVGAGADRPTARCSVLVAPLR